MKRSTTMNPEEISHYRAFGFVVLRDALARSELAALSDEADRVVPDATGGRYLQRRAGGGIEGHYIPATCELTPVSLRLAEQLAPVAEQLVGLRILLAQAQHILYFDMAGWHTDTGHSVPSVRVVAYLDPLDADSGALRVLPASHALPSGHLDPVVRGEHLRQPETWREAVRAVPANVVESSPGDIVVFDEHLWHASANGRNRRQWIASYVKEPQADAEAAAVRRYFASQFVPGIDLDYDAERYPHYGDHFRSAAPRRWVDQLERLGAFDAAAAEERRPDAAHGDYGTSTGGELTGERVVLRALRPTDVDELEAMFAEPAVARWWPHFDRVKIEGELLHPDDDTTVYAITIGGQLGGVIESWEEDDPDYRHAGIDIAVATGWHGTGVAVDALRTLARHLVETEDHHRLVIDPAAENGRAIACYEKVGFRRVGVMRKYERGAEGTFHDSILMDLLAEELK